MSIYVTIDVETTGQYLTQNDLVAFGVCVGDTTTGEIIRAREWYLKPSNAKDAYIWEQRCLDEFWNNPKSGDAKKILLDAVTAHGVPANQAMREFHEWINELPEDMLKNAVMISDTAGYDIAWLNLAASRAELPSMNYIFGGVYRPIRDCTSFNLGVAKQLPEDGLWGSTTAAISALGADPAEVLGKNPFKADHTPLNDARAMWWECLSVHRLIQEEKKAQ